MIEGEVGDLLDPRIGAVEALRRHVAAAEDALLSGLEADERVLLRDLLNKAAGAGADGIDAVDACEVD